MHTYKMRLPSFPTESSNWRRLFLRTKGRNAAKTNELLGISYTSTNPGAPPIVAGPTPAVRHYAPPADAVLSRASSEYSASISGGPPDDNYLDGEGDLYPDSPVSTTGSYDYGSVGTGEDNGGAYGNWSASHRRNESGSSSIPESMTTASTISSYDDSYSYGRGYGTNYATSVCTSPTVAIADHQHPSSRPASLFSSQSLYTRPTTSYNPSSSPSTPSKSFNIPSMSKRRETLVLTTTSRYPTGSAADRYSPVDVTMPGRGIMRRFTGGGSGAGGKRMSFIV